MSLRIGIFIGMGGGAAAFDPATLFGASDRGALIDYTTSANLFQTSAGTGAVNYGDPVGYVKNAAATTKPALQATSALRPVFSGMPRTLGTEAVSNGRFATDTVWTKGTGWTIAAGVGSAVAGTASSISQAATLTAGQAYFVTYNITRTAGTVTPQFTGGTTVAGIARSASGSYHDIIIAAAGNTTIEFAKDAAFAGSVDNLSVKPVSQFVNPGAMFDGLDDQMQTAAIDMSAGNKLTVILAAYYGQSTAIRDAVEVGNALSGTPGSALAEYASSPRGYLKGATALAQNDFTGGPKAGEARLFVSTFEFDPAAGTIATQITHRLAGAGQTGTPGGTSAGGGNIVNGAITIGSAFNSFRYWQGLIHRALVINRQLTSTERTAAEKWARGGMVFAAVLGDSTSAFNQPSDGLSYAPSTSSLIGGMAVGVADVSTVGEKIADMLTRWNAITDKSALQAVFIQIGLNDLNTYSGAGKSAAVMIADLQGLVNAVNAQKPAGCKTYVCTLTPARGWLGVLNSQQAQAYADWLSFNTAITGGGATPITGVDARISGHTAALNDGSGYLQAIYDHNADSVHPSAEGKFIIGQYWRAQLEADGLV